MDARGKKGLRVVISMVHERERDFRNASFQRPNAMAARDIPSGRRRSLERRYRRSPTRLDQFPSLDFVVKDDPFPFWFIIGRDCPNDVKFRRIRKSGWIPSRVQSRRAGERAGTHADFKKILNTKKGTAKGWLHPNAVHEVHPSLPNRGIPCLPCGSHHRPLRFKAAFNGSEIVPLDQLAGGRDEIRFFGPSTNDLFAALKIEIEVPLDTFDHGH